MYPFHMPGHKRAEGIKLSFPDPFSVDITEIDGFDNLHHPEGILKDSMIYGLMAVAADQYLSPERNRRTDCGQQPTGTSIYKIPCAVRTVKAGCPFLGIF